MRVSNNPRSSRAPSRRVLSSFSRSFPLLLCGTFLVLAPILGCGEDRAARSLIVICIDTLRADHVGAYGYSRDTTPVIDAFSGQAVRFDRAISTSNWTVPSVASVLTSAIPSRHGAGVSGTIKHLDKVPPSAIRAGLPTLAEVLRARGFRTGLFSANPFLYGSFKRSFDSSLVEKVPGEALADAALAWLAERPDMRNFLYVQFMDVHQPNLPPEPYFSYFETPGAGPRESRHSDWSFGALRDPTDPDYLSFRAHRIASYDGALRYVDFQIGRMLERMEALGVLREAVVVLYADHGEEFWDHAVEQSTQSDDPRGIWGIGHGHTMYQELLRVPLVVKDGHRGAGRVVDCPVSLLDLAPTALALLGIPVPPSMEGEDLTPHLDGTAVCRRRALVAESPAYGPDSAALLAWPLKLVRRGDSSRLYDLESDPRERKDIASAHAEETRRMEKALARLLRNRAQHGPATEIPKETLEQLRSLGYLGR